MWKIIISCIMITSLIAEVSYANVNYENFKVFSIVPKTQSQLEILQELREMLEVSKLFR